MIMKTYFVNTLRVLLFSEELPLNMCSYVNHFEICTCREELALFELIDFQWTWPLRDTLTSPVGLAWNYYPSRSDSKIIARNWYILLRYILRETRLHHQMNWLEIITRPGYTFSTTDCYYRQFEGQFLSLILMRYHRCFHHILITFSFSPSKIA